MKRYILLTNSRGSHFNIYDTEIHDTTGGYASINRCLQAQGNIQNTRYTSLRDFMRRTNFRTILAEFDFFETFHLEFPELLI
jgi:hypothetical protein